MFKLGMSLAALGLGAAQDVTVTSIPPGCKMLDGYDLLDGCKPSPVVVPQDCPAARNGDPCVYDDTSVSKESRYLEKLQSTKDQSNFMSNVASAEGGGWGVRVSASVSAMKQAQMTQNSLTFIVGASRVVYSRKVRNIVNLKLTNQAKRLLQNNPLRFIQNYGTHYVSDIMYGGSFIGIQNLNSRTESSSESLEVFASVSANFAFFDVDGSNDFKNKVSSSSSSLKYKTSVKARGGGNLPPSSDDPIQMTNLYETWNSAVADKPAGLKFVWRNWYDLTDVARTVDQIRNKTVRDMFTQKAPSTNTFNAVTQVYQKYSTIMHEIEILRTWDCARRNESLIFDLNNLYDTLNTEVAKIDRFHESNLHIIEDQIIKRDYTWDLNHNDKLFNLVNQMHSENCPFTKVYGYTEIDASVYLKAIGLSDYNDRQRCQSTSQANINSINQAKRYLDKQAPLSDRDMASFDGQSNNVIIYRNCKYQICNEGQPFCQGSRFLLNALNNVTIWIGPNPKQHDLFKQLSDNNSHSSEFKIPNYDDDNVTYTEQMSSDQIFIDEQDQDSKELEPDKYVDQDQQETLVEFLQG